MPSYEIPKKIGKYKIVRELGRGGMGVVYLAQDPFIDRKVAIKTTLSPPPVETQRVKQFQQIFFNEAKAAGKLMHPHIVSVYDAAVENDLYYLVMEYIGGSPLDEYCKKKNLLSLEKVLKIMFQCAKALDYAHKNGVIHRDIKPGNILISREGEAKISDFGIAVLKGNSTPRSDELIGSVHYTSPEQLRGESLTPQADLFSLGVVMYELLTGSKPFEADTDVATLFKIIHNDPKPLKGQVRDVSEALERVVRRALEKDLKRRYQSGMQFASELSASFDHLKFLDQEINFKNKFNDLKKIFFFRDFASSEIAEILKAASWINYEDTSIIIREGEIEECFYIIVAGVVKVIKHGKSIAVLKKGDCFGEMAYLGKTKRTATIEALGNAVLMKINASAIDSTSMGTQLRFYKVFANTLTHRLSRTSELLSTDSF